MPNESQRDKVRRWLPLGLLLLGFLGFFWLNGYEALVDLNDSWEKESQMEEAVRQLEDENARIETAIKELAPDGKAVEQIARQDLGYAKPGEIVVKIPDKE